MWDWLLLYLTPRSFPFAVHLGKPIRKPLCSLLWNQQGVQSTQALASLKTLTSCPHHNENQSHSLYLSLKPFWTCLGACPALNRKPQCVNNKPFQCVYECVFVCVCEHISLDIWFNFRKRASFLHSAETLLNKDPDAFHLGILPFSTSSLLWMTQDDCSSSCHHIHIPDNGKEKRRMCTQFLFQSMTSKLRTLFLTHVPLARI